MHMQDAQGERENDAKAKGARTSWTMSWPCCLLLPHILTQPSCCLLYTLRGIPSKLDASNKFHAAQMSTQASQAVAGGLKLHFIPLWVL
jgi:hypothetical protein